MRLDPDMPNARPFELLKIIVPVDALWVPALMPNGVSPGVVAVIVFPFIPNEMLFELEKTTVPDDTLEPAALIAAGAVDCE